jgi:hypothetical protein
LSKDASGSGVCIENGALEVDHENAIHYVLNKTPEADSVQASFLCAYKDIRVIL